MKGLVLTLAVLLLCGAMVNIVFWVKSDFWVSHASGVYLTLAKDLSEGLFYPDLYGDYGYRGTRYFPLYFSLHALLIKLLGNPLTAGYVLGLTAGLALLLGVYQFVRKIGGSVTIAIAFVAAILGCKLTQVMAISIRGDILPAALNTCGLALFVGNIEFSKKKLAAISLLFTLAFAAKVSAVFGVTAVCIVLLLRRNVRECVILALMTFVGFALVIGISELFSQGRFIEIINSCASAGTTLEGFRRLPRKVFNTILYLRWGSRLFLSLGFVSLLLLPKNYRTHVSPVYFLLVIIVTVATFSNPGLHVNHFLEPLVASVLLTATVFVARKDRFEVPALAGVGAALLIALIVLALSIFRTTPWKDPKRYAIVSEKLAGIKGPILSDNAYIPLSIGQRPFMLDAFMFRLIREKSPASDFEEPLFRKLENKWFAAVVLEKWAAAFPGLHFGDGFYDTVKDNYCLREETQQWLFYFRCEEQPVSKTNQEFTKPIKPNN